jgi:pyruvate dehydrogenase E2 component (dihydrolipoamide acetyltransferase)
MPKLGFDMAEGKIVRWLKRVGDPVNKGDILAEIETDKATVEVESEVTGVVRQILVPEGTSVPVGNPIAVVGAADEAIEEIQVAAPAKPEAGAAPERAAVTSGPVAQPAAAVSAVEGRLPAGVRASPIARQLAEAGGVDLAQVKGTGPGGRIVKRDIESLLARPEAAAIRAGEPQPSTLVPLSKLRATIGRRMTAAKQQIPHIYLTVDLDAGQLTRLREDLNAVMPEAQRISVNDLIVKAAALALREVPELNTSLEGDSLLRHGEVNVGIAVSVPDGLLTVVVRQADRKTVFQISEEARQMSARARAGKVRPQDIEGSTFTVSNLGMFDVDHFVAIINPPEAAILAVGAVREVPVVEQGQLRPGRRLKVTLSADHRVADGAQAARWLQAFRRSLEHPAVLLL